MSTGPGQPHRTASVWTRRTRNVLIISVALMLVAAVSVFIAPAVSQAIHESQNPPPSAEEVLERFLDHTLSADTAWVDDVAPDVAGEFPYSFPFFGDQRTAEELMLNAGYEVLNFELNSPDATEAYYASADVLLTYEFLFDVETVETATVQKVWLSRPFTEAGTIDFPEELGNRAQPGEWKVTALSAVFEDDAKNDWPLTGNNWSKHLNTLTDRSPATTECSLVNHNQILELLSYNLRETGQAGNPCLFEGGRGVVGLEYLKDEAFLSLVPFVDDFDPQTRQPDLLGFRGSDDEVRADELAFTTTPLFQTRFEGPDAAYTLTTLSIYQDAAYTSRIIAIVKDDAHV